MATKDFTLNFGTNPLQTNATDVMNPLTDFSSVLSSWGTPAAGGGVEFTTPPMFPAGTNTGASTPNANWQLDWFGGTRPDRTQVAGYIPTAVDAFSGLAGAYLGFQQMNLAKDQLEQNKRIFNLNFANQAQTVNTQLEDRQRARVASNPDAYESIDSYMNRNRVSSKGI